jgi:hypothetical protein
MFRRKNRHYLKGGNTDTQASSTPSSIKSGFGDDFGTRDDLPFTNRLRTGANKW